MFFALPVFAMAALDQNTVANINGTVLSKAEFERRYKANLQNFKYVVPTKQNMLNDMINFELGVQEARRLKLEKDPAVQERINAVLYQALVEQTLSEKFKQAVDISEKEAKDFCKSNPELRTSHVYVPLKIAALTSEEEEAYKKAKEAMAALNSGKKFEEVVAQYSSGFATGTGGDIGFQTKDRLDPAYYKAAAGLGVGQTTKEIVRSQFGLHIIKLTAKKSCDDVDITEFKRMVYDERRMKIFDQYLSSLRAKAKVAINKELIKE